MTSTSEINKTALYKYTSFGRVILKGIGQIMLQENPITGLLFLIGIFYGSLYMGLGLLLATCVGTLTSMLLKYEETEIQKGLYGFSAALVGVAVMLFLKPVLFSWILIVIGSFLAAVLQNFFIKKKIPVFTLPFVLVTWGILLLANNYLPGILADASPISKIADPYSFGFKGYGQVIFQASLFAGVVFFVGVFIGSPVSALFGFVGGILSGIIAAQLSAPVEAIDMGLFSYNAVLCAIVFAGNQIKDGMWAMLAILISLGISFLMSTYSITALTFPFVLASCICVYLKSKTNFEVKKLYASALQINH